MRKLDSKFDRISGSIRDYTSLLQPFEHGATREDVKKGIIQILSPYFKNKEILEEMAVNFLVPDTILFIRLSDKIWPIELLEHVLKSYWQAKAKNADKSFKACVDWLPAIYEGLSIFWSQYHLEVDKSSLDIEEFAHECFRNIGAIVEGAAKPMLRALLHQIRIGRGENGKVQTIETLDLGNVINELIQKSGYPSFFAPPPWSIRLNQWRNIAQHFSTRIEDDRIIGTYGSPPREVCLTREELLKVLERLNNTFGSIKLAQTVFFMDNVYEINAAGLLPQDVRVRAEASVLNFTAGLASQGFDLVDFRIDEHEAVAVIRDRSLQDPDERRPYMFQLAGALWGHTEAPLVSVVYQERDGTPNLRVQIDGELCEKVSKGEMPFSAIVEEADVIDLKTGAVIPRRPPESK